MDVIIPEIGESVFEAEIAKWHKSDGDTVAKDDLLCELETDKISLELNAEADGVIHIEAKEGETVQVGKTIATIEESGGAAKSKKEESEEESAPPEEKKSEEKEPAEESQDKAETEEPEEKPAPAEKEENKPQEPAKPQPPAAKPAAKVRDYGPVEREKMSPIRRKIAETLLAARQQTAMLTTFNEADMSRVIALRKKHQEQFNEKHGVKLGFMSFFIKAVVEALREYPLVNASIDGDEIVRHNYFHIGVAIGTERGLVVPVIRDAEKLHFAEIEKEIADFAEKANSGKLDLSNLEGGTFTISNGGVYGSVLSTPILNPPQSGVLGMHAIKEQPVVVDGEIVVRPIMNLALSYDHRIIDGREAVGFLKMIKEYIEDPEEMLLEL